MSAHEANDVSGDGAAVAACPACGAHVVPGELFCESCGAELAPGAGVPAPDDRGASAPPPVDAGEGPAPCAACGGTVAADGYCGTCGAPAVRPRDHWVEAPAPWVAGVCDRGIRHHRNEDAMALAAGPDPGGVAVLVVCDGVSSAPDSDVASLAAARAACDELCRAAGGHGAEDWSGAVERAVAAADAAARATEPGADADAGRSGGAPACTFVAAVVDGATVVTGCVGDSRAYWLPDAGPPVQLTTDDSWAAHLMADGVSREEAESGPQAHAITRWLGEDSPDPAPSLTTTTAEAGGWLVVCSDGLWNYCSAADHLAAVLAEADKAVGADPAALAAELVAWANGQGGHDNVTVALARLHGVPATAGPDEPDAAPPS